MILLLGATSYVGRAFARALQGRKDSFIPLSRKAFDYSRYEVLFDYVRKINPALVINAADHPGNSDSLPSETERMAMLQTNAILPQTIARVCAMTKTTLGHVSSGSIYCGAKVIDDEGVRLVEDLGTASTRDLFASRPESFLGFAEQDLPNCSFNSLPCTFYNGTKALAEDALRAAPVFIWRFQLPFNEQDDPQNFLSQLGDGLPVYDSINSISHLDECVVACLELWERHAPLGTYNVVNPGPIRTREVLQMIHTSGRSKIPLRLLLYDGESTMLAGRVPYSSCVLDGSKLLGAGIKLRTARTALVHALQCWKAQSSDAVKVSS